MKRLTTSSKALPRVWSRYWPALRLPLLLLTLWAWGAQPTLAQFTTPTLNGAIGTNEYGNHTDGQNRGLNGSLETFVTWDNTNLYVAVTGANLTEGLVLYLDAQPQLPVNGGSNADGTNIGFNYDGARVEFLPFRANLVAYVKNDYREFRTSNGSNGWGAANTAFGSYAQSGNIREFSLPWSSVGGRPSSFHFFAYNVSSTGFIYNQQPTANPGGSVGLGARYPWYFTVSNTANGASTAPFSRPSYVLNSASDVTISTALSVWDLTVNTSGRTLTRSGAGAWTIGGQLYVGTGSTLTFGSATGTTTVGEVLIEGTGGNLNMGSSTQPLAITNRLNVLFSGALNMSSSTGGLTVGGETFLQVNGAIQSSTSSGAIAFNGPLTTDASGTLNISNTGAPVRFNASVDAEGTVTINRPVIMGGSVGQALRLTTSGATSWRTLRVHNLVNLLRGELTLTDSLKVADTRSLVIQTATATRLNISSTAHGVLDGSGSVDLTGGSSQLVVNGTLTSNATSRILGTAANFTVGATGTYIHNRTDNSDLPLATWQTGTPGATCRVNQIGGAPTVANYNQTFPNFEWNHTTQSADISLGGTLRNVALNTRVLSTGTGTLLLDQTSGGTFNLGALTVAGGTLRLTTHSAGTFNVASITLSGGTLNLNQGSSSTITVNVSGNYAQTGGTMTSSTASNLVFGGATAATLSQTAGTITGNIQLDAGSAGNIKNVTLGSNLTMGSGTGWFRVLSGTTMIFGTNLLTVNDGIEFSVLSGGFVRTANSDAGGALNTTGGAGSVRGTGTRTISTGAQLQFNGSAPQFSGNAVTNVSGIALFNTSDVALTTSGTTQVLGLFEGRLILGNHNLTVNNTGVTVSSNPLTEYLVTNGTGRFIRSYTASAISDIPVGLASSASRILVNPSATGSISTRVTAGFSQPVTNVSKAVNREYYIESAVTGTHTLTLQWLADAHGTNFDPNDSIEVAASTTGPYVVIAKFPNAPIVNGFHSVTLPARAVTAGVDVKYVVGNIGAFSGTATFTWRGGVSSDWGTAGNWLEGAVPTADGLVIIDGIYTNELTLGTGESRTIADFTLSGGRFTALDDATLTVTRSLIATSPQQPVLSASSSIVLSSTTAMSVPSWSYGNLTTTGGPRTLASTGTIQIRGTYTPSTAAQTTVGTSTVDFAGAGAQTIPAGAYFNLTNSSNTPRSWGTGTVEISGALTPSTVRHTLATGSIVSFIGAAGQAVPGGVYATLQLGNAARTLSPTDTIFIGTALTPGTGVHTITNSRVLFFRSVAGTYVIPALSTTAPGGASYHHLILKSSETNQFFNFPSTGLGIAGNLTNRGSGFLVMIPTGTPTITISGDLIHEASRAMTFSTSGGGTVNIGGEVRIRFFATLTAPTGGGQTLTVTATGGTWIEGATGILTLESGNTTSRAILQTTNLTLDYSGPNVTLDMGSGTNNGTTTATGNNVLLSGDMILTRGRVGFTGTYSQFSGIFFTGGGTHSFTQVLGTLENINVGIDAGNTLSLASNMTFTGAPGGVALFGTLQPNTNRVISNGSSAGFSVETTGTLIINDAAGFNGTLQNFPNNASLTRVLTGGILSYRGTGAQSTGFTGYTTSLGSANPIVEWAGTAGQTLSLDANLGLGELRLTNNGFFALGNNNLTLLQTGAITGGPFSASKMVVTNGTGRLIRTVTSAGVGLPFTWPIGETTGATEYSPVTVAAGTFPSTTTIGFRVVDDTPIETASNPHHLSRFWPMTISASSYTLPQATFTYTAADVVGSEGSMLGALYLPVSSAWVGLSGSTVASNTLTIPSGIASGIAPGGGTEYIITARQDIPIYYRSVATGSWATPATWETSTDPLFSTATPATVAPNALNSAGILVRNGHTVTISGTAISADQLTIAAGGTVIANAALNIANGTGTDLTLEGTLTNAVASTWSTGTAVVTTAGSRLNVNGSISNFGTLTVGGILDYGLSGTVPTATWQDGSELIYSGFATGTPGGLNQNFYRVTWESPGQSGIANLNGTLTTIRENFNVVNTGGQDLRMTGSNLMTATVGGNLTVSAGASLVVAQVNMSFTPNASTILTVNGNMTVSGFFTLLGSNSTAGGPIRLQVNGSLTYNSVAPLGFAVTTGAGSATATIAGDLNYTGAGNLRVAAGGGAGTLTVLGNCSKTGTGTLALSAGSGAGTVLLRGNLTHTAGIIQSTGSGAGVLQFDRASGLQEWDANGGTITGTSTGLLINIGSGSTANTVRLLSDISLANTVEVRVQPSATLDMGGNLVGTGTGGTFTTLSGSTIRIGHPDGIAAGTAASGNVRVATARTYNAGGNYRYTGTTNQTTGTGLPATLSGQLVIDNSGATDNTVMLTSSAQTVSTITLLTGQFAIGTGLTMTVANGGSVNGSGGDFVNGAAAGTILVPSGASIAFNGTLNPWIVTLQGQANFGGGTVRIRQALNRVGTGAGVISNAPFYGPGSTLVYDGTGNPTARGLEWSGTTDRGVPHNVLLINGAVLSPGAIISPDYRNITLRANGNLTIAAGSSLFMDFGGRSMTVPLNVRGNILVAGSLSMSQSIGGDILVGGDFTVNVGSGFFPNGRELLFDGTGDQVYTVPTGQNLAFAGLAKPSGRVLLAATMNVESRLRLEGGLLILGTHNVTLTQASAFIQNNTPGSSFIVSNGTGFVQAIVGSTDRFFPVGPNDTTFASLTLNQSGTQETVTVRTTIAPPFQFAVNNENRMLGVQWVLTESVAGSNNYAMTFGWRPSAELTEFNRTQAIFHGNWNAGAGIYNVSTSQTLTGTDPFFSRRSTSTPFTGSLNTTFVVGQFTGILPCANTAQAGPWISGSTWQAGTSPPLGASVCIFHPVTIVSVSPPAVAQVSLEPGGSLFIDAGHTLTIQSGGGITNASGIPQSVSGPNGRVRFLGLGVIDGSQPLTFRTLELNGNTTLTTAPTIEGALEINAGAFVMTSNSPNYDVGSVLRYQTGGPYNRSNEWTAATGQGAPHSVLVTGNTQLNIGTGTAANRTLAGNLTVASGSSVSMGAMTVPLTIGGNFVLDGGLTMSTNPGGDIALSGNWLSGASATLTANNRDVRFAGTTAQTIQTLSPISFGFLTIDNTGTGVTLLNPITVGTFRVNPARSFSMSTSKITISPAGSLLINGTFVANNGTIEYTNGGTFVNNGTFDRGTSTIDFLGSNAGVIGGTVQTNFHNIRLFPGGGIDFGGGAIRGRVSGTFQLRAGSFVANNAPIYEPGSKLMYSGGGTFSRNVEWDPNTVQKVEVTNNTTLLGGVNGTGFNHQMADSLIIRAGSAVDMATPSAMTTPLRVGGSLLLGGTLTLSTQPGARLELGGNFVNDGGVYTCNNQPTTMVGTADASILGPSINLCQLTVSKAPGARVTLTQALTLAPTVGSPTVRIRGGILDVNTQAFNLTGPNRTLWIDSGYAQGQTLRTGNGPLPVVDVYRNRATAIDSLGGRVVYDAPSGSTALSAVVRGYNQLFIEGLTGSVKTVGTEVFVRDTLSISSASTLELLNSAGTFNARGHVELGGTVVSTLSRLAMNRVSGPQTLRGRGSVALMTINNPAGVAGSGRPVVTGNLSLSSGKLDMGNDTIVLTPTATLTETFGASQNFVRGNVFTQRIIGTSAADFGGIGVQLTAGADLGTVTVNRRSGQPVTGQTPCCLGNESILRVWTIEPSVQPATADRNLTLLWPSEDDNGRFANIAQLYKSPDGIALFEKVGPVVNAAGSDPRAITLTGIESFSVFTVSDDVTPLPIGLIRFEGRLAGKDARLTWQLSGQAPWRLARVEKSLDGRQFAPIGEVAMEASGGMRAQDYEFIDTQLERTSFYRLYVTDAQGVGEYTRTVVVRPAHAPAKDLLLTLQPNPTASVARLTQAGRTDLSIEVRMAVISPDGRTLRVVEGTLATANQALMDLTPTLPAGLYQVQVQSALGRQVLKLIKQ